MLQLLFILTISLAAGTALILAVLVWRYVSCPARQVPQPAAAWLNELSVDRYLPMLRLLDESDFRFLRTQPGFTPQMAVRLRAHRYRMFVAYLRNLRDDFDGITAALRFVLAHSSQDRPDLSAALLRAQLGFAWGFALAHARAYAWSLGFGDVDSQKLLHLFDGIHVELRGLVAQPMSC